MRERFGVLRKIMSLGDGSLESRALYWTSIHYVRPVYIMLDL